jgi:hypothetical protein
MRKATREWVQEAEDDYVASVDLQDGPDRLDDQICFHCHAPTSSLARFVETEPPDANQSQGLMIPVEQLHPGGELAGLLPD